MKAVGQKVNSFFVLKYLIQLCNSTNDCFTYSIIFFRLKMKLFKLLYFRKIN